MNANIAREVSKNRKAGTYSGIFTDEQISELFRQTAGGSTNGLRVDVFVGKTSVVGSITLKHQHSNLSGLWSDGKTSTLSTASSVSVTVNPTTNILTATSHGLVTNQPVVVSATTMPDNLLEKTIYYVLVIDSNNFYLLNSYDGQIIDITSAGVGVLVIPVRVFSITYLSTVAGDSTHLPLRSVGRIVLSSTNASDYVDILSIKLNQED